METKPSRRAYGTGSLYQPKGKNGKKCSIWHTKVYVNGRVQRESTGTSIKSKAQKILTERKSAADRGELPDMAVRKVRVSELAEDMLRDYRINSQKSTEHVRQRWQRHLLPFFGEMRAAGVDITTIERYVDTRKEAGAANATINRELAALKRAFNVGRVHKKVLLVPLFPYLKENAPRSGFVDDAEYEVLSQKCEETWLQALLAVAYTFGFRRGELLNLRVRQVNLLNHAIALDPGTTKNDEARLVKMEPNDEIELLLRECIRGKEPNDFVFTREDGTPVRNLRGAWQRACVRAGLGKLYCPMCGAIPEDDVTHCKGCRKRLKFKGLLLHDMRRSAVRNMRLSGVDEKVARQISGHKTLSVFQRYNITDERDVADAMRKLREFRAANAEQRASAQAAETNGHDLGTNAPRTVQ